MSKHVSNSKSRHLSASKRREVRHAQKGIPAWLRIYPELSFDRECYELSLPWGLCLLFSALLLIASAVVSEPFAVHLALSLVSFAAAAAFVIRNLIHNLTHGRPLCEALLILLAGALCLALQLFAQGTLILLFYQLAKAAELRFLARQQKKARLLLDLLPHSATLWADGEEQTIKPVHICAGDVLIVREKEIIPVDGTVQAGLSEIDASPLTNRDETYPIRDGDRVRQGCINIAKPIIVLADCDYADSTAQKHYAAYTSLLRRQGSYELLTEKLCNYLTPAMLLCAVLAGVIVPIFTGRWQAGLRTAVLFLLLSCPYALPGVCNLALFTCLTRIFSSGIRITDIDLPDRLARLETFICNKTGTITESQYTVTGIYPEGIDEDRLKAIVGQVESRSRHPIAEAIRRYAGVPYGAEIPGLEIEELETLGLSAAIGENQILIGNAALLHQHDITCEVPKGQGSAVHVAINGAYCGYLLLENRLREGNFEAIEQMGACGVKSFALLSGDRASIVRPIAGELNFDIVKGELTREGKSNAADYLMSNRTRGRTVAYAGDGSGEAESAEHTDVSIVTGALRRETAEKADVTIFAEGIGTLPLAVRAGHSCARIALTALIAFSALRAAGVILALVGILPPWLAGLALALSEAALYFCASDGYDRF